MTERPPLAIVTGAARRVGRAVALELARAGCDLVLTYRTSREEMTDTVDLCRSAASNAAREGTIWLETVCAELAETEGWKAIANAVEGRPAVDVLVHNASSYGSSPFGKIDADDVRRHFHINALSALMLTQALHESLRCSELPGGGCVVCFSDIHTLGRPRRDFAAYAMSKAGLNQVVHNLARDMAPHVRINGIAPGVIAWPDGTDDSERQAYEKRTPLGRSGTPEDAARLVRWLAFDAPFMTGEIIRIDGGRWLV